MKICAYCGSENADSATVCSACGASAFRNKCSNCGTIFETAYCPSCGTKAGMQAKKCPQCGEMYCTPACPKCGYNGALNRGQKQTDDEPKQVIVEQVPQAQPVKAPKKKVTFGKVLLWIFFLPIMAIIAIWRSQRLTTKWKLILTAIIAVLAILYYGYGSRMENSSETKHASSQYAVRSQATNAVTAAPKATAQATAVPKRARKGFGEGKKKYTLQNINFFVPDYFGKPANTSTETTLHFTEPREKGIILLAFNGENNNTLTKERFDALIEQSFLNVFQDAKLIDSKPITLVGFPGRKMSATGIFSNVHVHADAVFAIDEEQNRILGLVLMQGDNAQYDYSSDFDKIIASTTVVRQEQVSKSGNNGGVSTDLKLMLDDYEAFIDSYCAFLEKYSASNDVSGMAMEYLNMLTKYTEWATRIDNIDEDSLSEADLLYYTEVTLRCTNKIAKASVSIGNW